MHIFFIVIAFFLAWLGGHALDWIFTKLDSKFSSQNQSQEALKIIDLGNVDGLNKMALRQIDPDNSIQEVIYFFPGKSKQELHENQPFTPAK